MSDERKAVFCTLCEGDYHLGAAALLNSLVSCGFSGVFVIGWRGAPPPWIETLGQDAQGNRIVGGVRVKLEEMRTPWLLAHVKPRFMLDILERLVPEAESVCYADPDIVVEAPWWFFENWLNRGVALCEDCCFPCLSRHHYLRLCWQELARDTMKLAIDATIERYYNSGFAGVRRKDAVFLEVWDDALLAMEKAGVPMHGLKPGTRLDPFYGTDQDAMNIAAMAYGGRLATLGPEGMGFTSGMTAMWHAVNGTKPWRCFYLWELLQLGRAVPQAHRQFWKHSVSPVNPWRSVRYLLKRLDLRVTIVLSRIYHAP